MKFHPSVVRMAIKGLLSAPVLWLILLSIQVSLGTDELRLSNGTGPCSGRVEVKHEEQWGTVCDGDWTIKDAEVVCKQLKCGFAVKAVSRAHFGQGTGPTWLYRVDCRGDESALWNCSHTGWGVFTCPHYFDTGVICSGFSDLRLTGGDTACSGHLKVKKEETWATVCFSHIDFKTASVICNELECGQAVDTLRGTHFGDRHELIWQEEFHCVGNETHLAACPRNIHHTNTCSHDATVVCSGYGGYRLANGNTTCSGRVELLHGGTWGTLCDYLWDLPAANILCQQLDCGVALLIPSGQSFGEGNGTVWNATFSYQKNGSLLRDCLVRSLGQDECPAGKEAHVVCSGCPGGRLVNGTTCSGIVEIRHGDTWGRLCHSHWNLQAASVFCHQLNCGYAKSIQMEDSFVDGNGPIWRDAFHCKGTESCLWDCVQVTLGNPTCSAKEVATVTCSGLAESLRLSGGESRCGGRVEISLHGAWSRVLDDDWDIRDAHVVCRQLQCGTAEKAYYLPKSERGMGLVGLRSVQCTGNETQLMLCNTSHYQTVPTGVSEDVGVICSATMCKHLGCGDGGGIATDFQYGRGSGPTWLDHIECTEQHSSLWQCQSDPWDPQSCNNRAEETHITCTGRKEATSPVAFAECPNSTSCSDREKLRVVGGEDECSGRVEMWHQGSWGTICDDAWDVADANVVCRQLGCGSAVSALSEAAFGEGTGPIWLEKVHCKGTELSLWDCPAKPLFGKNCDHKEDAAVNCSGVTETTASPTRADRPRRPVTGSTRLSLPIVLCIILGTLLCLVLAILAGQIRRARAQQRGSRLSYDPFSEAVYEEIDYNLMREKQGVTFLSEASPLPENALEDGYDDATEAPRPRDASCSEQNEQEIIGIPEESDRNKDSQTDWIPRNRTSEAERSSSPALEDTGYDDIEELGH
ncbi:antigen WC1.1-like isoform X4 [Anomalospiza imberbis]|uniref:antigen WC1.1-like isoform X4 n=1 Tax=Anomalospiza imberbis TaxID=187417 RepID=UPI00358F4659